jgi:hypothetical protein
MATCVATLRKMDAEARLRGREIHDWFRHPALAALVARS